MKNSKLIFYGGAKSVTGANFMLQTENQKILVDCGLIQGEHFCEEENCGDFQYNPEEIDFLLVTHAHADHIGRIPKLVHEGFSGKIYSTPETKEIAGVMLNDALKFVIEEAREENREPIYVKEDIAKTLQLWEEVPYHQEVNLKDEASFNLKDAGHILGSSIIEVKREERKIIFTGDLGNSPAPFLRNREDIEGANYIVIESVYGDRIHEEVETRKQELREVIEGVIKKGGTLVIPAFSVSRTQILLYELNDLIENNKIESIPVYLDSPLAIKITEIYRERQKNFKKEAKDLIESGDKVFDFPKLDFTETVQESKKIAKTKGPKIIIAGSGMSTGGRVIHHEKRYLSDEGNTILIVGYQVPGSLGRKIQDGAKKVTIHESEIPVRAEIKTITGYSGHADSDALLDFVADSMDTLEKVFVVIGEPKASMFLSQKIKDNLGVEALNPEKNKPYPINF